MHSLGDHFPVAMFADHCHHALIAMQVERDDHFAVPGHGNESFAPGDQLLPVFAVADADPRTCTKEEYEQPGEPGCKKKEHFFLVFFIHKSILIFRASVCARYHTTLNCLSLMQIELPEHQAGGLF